MKKLIAFAITACMGFSCIYPSAMASSRTDGIYDALEGRDEIHIIYNDAVVKYDDVKPVNTEGRVMIPFRAALENMGAAVDYSADDRKVTATKGNITITFTLMDDTIYIDNNGQQSTIKMDVPMLISQDRTFVPIRFMSNAFGMQVGWDGDTQTVVIMDYDDYFDNIASVAPNMAKLASLKTNTNKSTVTFDMSLNASGGEENTAISASGKADAASAGGTAEAEVTINLKNGSKTVFDNASISAVVKDYALYIKTDAISQLAVSSTDDAVKAASALVSGDKWYRVDLVKLLQGVGMSNNTARVFSSALVLSGGEADMAEILKSYTDLNGDAKFEDTLSFAAMLDVYEALDKYITITEKETDGYSVSVNIKTADFEKIIRSTLASTLTDEELNAVLENADYNLTAGIDSDGKTQTSSVDFDSAVSFGDISLSFKLKLNEKSETDSSVTSISVPETSTDITNALLTIFAAK